MRRRDANENNDEERQTSALMGLIVILILAIAALYLVRELRFQSNLEDCLMQGRTDCAPPIDLPERPY